MDVGYSTAYDKQSSVVEPGRCWCPSSSLGGHMWPERQAVALVLPATPETSPAGSRTENYHSEYNCRKMERKKASA